MGKGDKKTAKGKRIMGSYGVTRPKKKSDGPTPVAKEAKATSPAADAAPKTVSKPAAKKPAAEKTAAPKKTTKKEA